MAGVLLSHVIIAAEHASLLALWCRVLATLAASHLLLSSLTCFFCLRGSMFVSVRMRGFVHEQA